MSENTSAKIVKEAVTRIPRDQFGELLADARVVCKTEVNDKKAVEELAKKCPEHADKPPVLINAVRIARKEAAKTPEQKRIEGEKRKGKKEAWLVVEVHFRVYPNEDRHPDKVADDIMSSQKPNVGHSEISKAVYEKQTEIRTTATDAVTTYFTDHPADILDKFEDIASRISSTVSKGNLIKAIGFHLRNFNYEDRKIVVFNYCIHLATKTLKAEKRMPKELVAIIKTNVKYLSVREKMLFAACCEAFNRMYPKLEEGKNVESSTKPQPRKVKNPGSAAKKTSKAEWIAAGCPRGGKKKTADTGKGDKDKNNKGGNKGKRK